MYSEVSIKSKAVLSGLMATIWKDAILPAVSTKFSQVSKVHKYFKILYITVETHCLSYKKANQA